MSSLESTISDVFSHSEDLPPSVMNETRPISTSQSMGLIEVQFSETRRQQLDFINKLQILRVSRDFDLPQIVVIGSQSAGKSSLIESISGITLPRSTSTCTRFDFGIFSMKSVHADPYRCPTECRLIQAPGEDWRCDVSIRFITGDYGKRLPQEKTIIFGPPIFNREDIEDRIRRVQSAALNPSSGMESTDYFLSTGTPPSNGMLDSTPNYISLEIRGPELTDLVSDDDHKEEIDKVRELVSSYITKPSCIILLILSCETDFETQRAYRLPKQYDPKGMRTIGVLTKPDCIPEGETSNWISLIKTSALHSLTDGSSRPQAWSSFEITYQRQLGTVALTKSLSQHLLDLISKMDARTDGRAQKSSGYDQGSADRIAIASQRRSRPRIDPNFWGICR
ncbi:hypothetical protein M422DRAFT_241963 [Sphaerobolus stellatus SS14]|nr:hypothetical protein M422DRAFT_241963 [Sphaerobolus stellatus SS14]